MRFVAKLAFFLFVVAALLPTVAGDTHVGKIVSATMRDAVTFCERQGDACRAVGKLVKTGRDALQNAIAALHSRDRGAPLTVEDLTLTPQVDAFAAHNQAPPTQRP